MHNKSAMLAPRVEGPLASQINEVDSSEGLAGVTQSRRVAKGVSSAPGRPNASNTLPRSPALADPKRCNLYFIAGAGLIKIGITTDLTSRLRSIRNSSPVPLEVLAIYRGATQFNEMLLHGEFAALRRHGEWFEDDGKIRAHIAGLVASGKAEIPAENRPMAYRSSGKPGKAA